MKVRNYQDVLDRIFPALDRSEQLTVCHHTHSALPHSEYPSYPLYCLYYTNSLSSSPLIYVSAGIHGDEPAGVECAIRIIEQLSDHRQYNYCESLLDKFNWVISPCDNPFGYERDIRENRVGLDLNRMFENPNQTLETEFITKSLMRLPYHKVQKHLSENIESKRVTIEIALDLHEDKDSSGFYLWERRKANHSPIGTAIVNKVEAVCPINQESMIEDHTNVNGVITLLDQVTSKGWTRGRYLAEQENTRCLILETPTRLDWDTRINAHMLALQAVIEAQ